jgi:hypothetical protein
VQPTLTTILPCNDLDRTEAFFVRLDFNRENEVRMIIGCSPTASAGKSIVIRPS